MHTPPHPLRLRRVSAGLSQSALADAVGISQQLMSKLENQTIPMTPARAHEFAQILGCSPLDLLPSLQAEEAVKQDEIELISIFRDLDPRGQNMLLIMARAVRTQALSETIEGQYK